MSLTLDMPYLKVPVLDELFTKVEDDPKSEQCVIAMASALRSYYFPIQQGSAITQEQNQENNTTYFIVRRWRSHLLEIPMVNHLIVEARGKWDGKPTLPLRSILRAFKAENDTCWMVHIRGLCFIRRKWDAEIKSERTPEGLAFLHLGDDNLRIDSMLREIARTAL